MSDSPNVQTLRSAPPFDRQECTWPGREAVRVGWTLADRSAPQRTTPETARRLALHFGRRAAFVRQVHGAELLTLRARGPMHAIPPLADGIITDRRDLLLGVSVADCAPIFLVADDVMGVLHAGWRGVLQGILPMAMELLNRVFGLDPQDVELGLGPCIGPCCFEVSGAVALLFPPQTRRPSGDRYFLDLPGAIIDQWLRHGGRPETAYRFDRCTSCSRPLLHSYRRRGGRGRNFAYVMASDMRA